MSQTLVREFRDSLGRTPEEHSGQGFGSLTIVEILDPGAGFDWVLDPTAQVSHRMVAHSQSPAGSRALRPCNPGGAPATRTIPDGIVTTSEPLGPRTIEGIAVCGLRIAITRKAGTPGTASELWSSREDVGAKVLDKLFETHSGAHVMQLENVRLSEPDPGLFVPPPANRVADETASFTILGPAPDAKTSDLGKVPATRMFTAQTGMLWSGDFTDGTVVLSHQFRDSMGRTRREPLAGSTGVTIDDPVAGYAYTLDPALRTAHRRPVTFRSKPASEASVPMLATTTTQLPNGGTGRNEPLGTKTIDGVLTYGNRVTLTYPPGSASGNDKTTSTVNESWISPQLGLTVRIQASGAMVPTGISSLTNIKYGEPDSALFEVSDGYTVIDQ